jgi:hypothetical protein
MDAILPGHQVSDEDTYNRFLKRKGPSVVADFIDGRGDFGRYLRQIAPMGAPALRCWADWEPEPCPLPLIAPLLAPRTNASDRSSDWLVRALERIEIGGKPLKEISKTAELLAPGPCRPLDGLPAWWSHLEPAWAGNWQPRGPQPQGQRTGRVRRDLLAPVCVDLHGRPLAWASGTVLGLSDHEEFTKAGKISKDPRNARRYRDRGRALLALLGVWPWASAPHGRLMPNWQEDRSFMFSLECWVSRANDDLRGEIARTDRALSAIVRADGDRGAYLRGLSSQ